MDVMNRHLKRQSGESSPPLAGPHSEVRPSFILVCNYNADHPVFAQCVCAKALLRYDSLTLSFTTPTVNVGREFCGGILRRFRRTRRLPIGENRQRMKSVS